MDLYLDIETRARCNLKTSGLHRYAEEAEIVLVQIARDEGPVQVAEWVPGMARVLQHDVNKADRVFYHADEFDRVILARHGVEIPLEKAYSTMAQARRHGLPGGLDKLCEVLRVPQDQAKWKEGRRAMLLFCKPLKDGTWATKHTHPKEWATYVEYSRLDIAAMRAVHARCPTWNDSTEAGIWRLDQRINARGFAVDVEFAQSAVAVLQENAADLREQTSNQTGGVVGSATQRDALLRFILAEHGVSLPDLASATIERRMGDEALPEAVRSLLALRQQSVKTSTGKYKTLLATVNNDGRLRGTKTYCGAARTARWAGKIFQPDNLKRPTLPSQEIAQGIEAIKLGVYDLVGRGATVPEILSNAVRGCVVAPPGKKLIVADFANIEGRVLAWLTGEEWKLGAFRDYDAGTGPDLYLKAYSEAFRIPVGAVSKAERQVGKVMELMLGYQGGVGAFITGAETYGVDLDALARVAWPAIPPAVQGHALKAYEWAVERQGTYGLDHITYATCDALKRLWRARHQGTEMFWSEIEQWVRQGHGGNDFVRVDRKGTWTRIRLPSGRYLCYPGMRVEAGELNFLGVSQYTKQWGRISTYGGKLTENIVQAIARDLLANALLLAEQDGLPPVAHVHDEIIAEVERDVPLRRLLDAMRDVPEWAQGLPLAAAGFETDRYRKE
jgi:DNA polymerase